MLRFYFGGGAPEVDGGFWFGLPPEVMRDIHPFDEFRLAQSRVGPTDVTEDDLFEGVRSG